MEQEAYKSMFELEQAHWWYKGLHELLLVTVQKIADGNKQLRILDAGCGTGFILKELDNVGLSLGIDISEVALGYCKKRNIHRIAQASVSKLPFCEETLDIIILADVLYHKLVSDDEVAINELHRVLRKNGILILNVPAHDTLRRHHDEAIHTRHRYGLRELSNKIEKSGFAILKISYRNSFLLPIIFFLSFIKRRECIKKSSDLRPVPKGINYLFYHLARLENSFIHKFNLPFGSSIFCVAKRKIQQHVAD